MGFPHAFALPKRSFIAVMSALSLSMMSGCGIAQRIETQQAQNRAALQNGIQTCDVTYVVHCNNRATVVYRDAQGVERSDTCSYGEDWWYGINNPSRGQLLQVSAQVNEFSSISGTPELSVKIYVRGQVFKDDSHVGATANYAGVTAYW